MAPRAIYMTVPRSLLLTIIKSWPKSMYFPLLYAMIPKRMFQDKKLSGSQEVA